MKKPANKMPVVDVETLKFDDAELGLEVGITSFSPTLHSSPTPIPTDEPLAKELTMDNQPPLTTATIFAFS